MHRQEAIAVDRPEEFHDGLGVRFLRTDGSGDTVQVLRLCHEIASMRMAITERVARLSTMRLAQFAHVRSTAVPLEDSFGFEIVSDHVPGVRLSEILDLAGTGRLVVGMDAALHVIRQLLGALAGLHQSRGVTHGAIGPERILVTPRGHVVLADYVLGLALQRLELPRSRLWRVFRIPMPVSSGTPQFDQEADIAQVGVVALALLGNRPLQPIDYPGRLLGLVEALGTSPGSHAQVPKAVKAWFKTALQFESAKRQSSARDVQTALEAALSKERRAASAVSPVKMLFDDYQRAVAGSGSETNPTRRMVQRRALHAIPWQSDTPGTDERDTSVSGAPAAAGAPADAPPASVQVKRRTTRRALTSAADAILAVSDAQGSGAGAEATVSPAEAILAVADVTAQVAAPELTVRVAVPDAAIHIGGDLQLDDVVPQPTTARLDLQPASGDVLELTVSLDAALEELAALPPDEAAPAVDAAPDQVYVIDESEPARSAGAGDLTVSLESALDELAALPPDEPPAADALPDQVYVLESSVPEAYASGSDARASLDAARADSPAPAETMPLLTVEAPLAADAAPAPDYALADAELLQNTVIESAAASLEEALGVLAESAPDHADLLEDASAPFAASPEELAAVPVRDVRPAPDLVPVPTYTLSESEPEQRAILEDAAASLEEALDALAAEALPAVEAVAAFEELDQSSVESETDSTWRRASPPRAEPRGALQEPAGPTPAQLSVGPADADTLPAYALVADDQEPTTIAAEDTVVLIDSVLDELSSLPASPIAMMDESPAAQPTASDDVLAQPAFQQPLAMSRPAEAGRHEDEDSVSTQYTAEAEGYEDSVAAVLRPAEAGRHEDRVSTQYTAEAERYEDSVAVLRPAEAGRHEGSVSTEYAAEAGRHEDRVSTQYAAEAEGYEDSVAAVLRPAEAGRHEDRVSTQYAAEAERYEDSVAVLRPAEAGRHEGSVSTEYTAEAGRHEDRVSTQYAAEAEGYEDSVAAVLRPAEAGRHEDRVSTQYTAEAEGYEDSVAVLRPADAGRHEGSVSTEYAAEAERYEDSVAAVLRPAEAGRHEDRVSTQYAAEAEGYEGGGALTAVGAALASGTVGVISAVAGGARACGTLTVRALRGTAKAAGAVGGAVLSGSAHLLGAMGRASAAGFAAAGHAAGSLGRGLVGVQRGAGRVALAAGAVVVSGLGSAVRVTGRGLAATFRGMAAVARGTGHGLAAVARGTGHGLAAVARGTFLAMATVARGTGHGLAIVARSAARGLVVAGRGSILAARSVVRAGGRGLHATGSAAARATVWALGLGLSAVRVIGSGIAGLGRVSGRAAHVTGAAAFAGVTKTFSGLAFALGALGRGVRSATSAAVRGSVWLARTAGRSAAAAGAALWQVTGRLARLARREPDAAGAVAAGPARWAMVRGLPWPAARYLVLGVVVLLLGRPSLQLVKDGWRQVQLSTASAQAANTAAPVTPAKTAGTTGSVRVESEPAGAQVWLDGALKGVTPLVVEQVKAGEHGLILLDASGTVKATVRVEAGETAEILVPIFSGWLAAFAPTTLQIFEGGVAVGTTEDGRILMKPGEHTLELVSARLGYRATHVVEVKPGEVAALNVTLPTAPLEIVAPDGAEIWVDGRQLGTAPLEPQAVAVGTCEVLMRHPVHGEQRQSTTVTYRTPNRVVFTTPS